MLEPIQRKDGSKGPPGMPGSHIPTRPEESRLPDALQTPEAGDMTDHVLSFLIGSALGEEALRDMKLPPDLRKRFVKVLAEVVCLVLSRLQRKDEPKGPPGMPKSHIPTRPEESRLPDALQTPEAGDMTDHVLSFLIGSALGEEALRDMKLPPDLRKRFVKVLAEVVCLVLSRP